jgi:hypothetical protein
VGIEGFQEAAFPVSCEGLQEPKRLLGYEEGNLH